MKAEFLKDENGNIWFTYASEIQMRSRIKGAPPTSQAENTKQKQAELEEKEDMIEEIEEY